MKTREQKGLEIAAVNKLVRKGTYWLVPSQAGNGTRYRVNLKEQHCTCPDHERREIKCKHLYAVEFTVKRETAPDGTTTVTKTMKVTYGQDWPAYNAAQSEENPASPYCWPTYASQFPNRSKKTEGRAYRFRI